MMYFFSMYISGINLDNFRNYNTLALDIPTKGALFVGANGAGKTNLLEAVFLLCTARSQRGSSRSELIRFGSEYCHVQGTFTSSHASASTTVSIGLGRDQKVSMRINDKPISSFSQWLGHSIAVSFSPHDLKLVQGIPKERRNFLDLIISQIDPLYLDSLICYKKSCSQRNNLLVRRIFDAQLDAFEEEMVKYGSYVFAKRQEILDLMNPIFKEFYQEISGKNEAGSFEYKPSISCDSCTQNDWKNVFFTGIKNARNKDIQNGYSSVGPHRDDIVLFVNGKDARTFASLGQCTTTSLALKMSSVLVSQKYKGDEMVFLFDDAANYLDSMRTARVFPLLSDRGQILMTAPLEREPQNLDIPKFCIQEGSVLSL